MSEYSVPARWRVFLRYLLPSLLFVATVLAAFGYQTYQAERQSREAQMHFALSLGKEELRNTLFRAAQDLTQIVYDEEMERLAGDHSYANKAKAIRYILRWMRLREVYEHIRYIDTRGRELVRVNHGETTPIPVATHDLQDKSERYYFGQSSALGRREIYLSPMDLNVEHGAIQRPIKPTLRFAAPVFDALGRKSGVMIINYSARALIERLRLLMAADESETMLLNPDGYWLAAPFPELEWGFMLDHQRRFSATRPEVWRVMNAGERGVIESDHGVFVFDTIRPLRAGYLEAFTLRNGIDDENFHWKLVKHIPGHHLSALKMKKLGEMAGIFSLIALLLILAAWYYAGVQQRRWRAERALAESVERYRSLAEAAHEAIISIDDQDRVTSWNRGARETFGYEEREMLGRSVTRIMPEKHRAAHRAAVGRAADGGALKLEGRTVELEAERKGGERIEIEFSLSSWYLGGRRHFSAIIRDISERKGIERQLHDTLATLDAQVAERTGQLKAKVRELESTREELINQEKMASLGRLVAGFAHEINTPIGIAVGANSKLSEATAGIIHMLESDAVDEERLIDHLETIESASELALNNLRKAAELVGSFKRTSIDQSGELMRTFDVAESIHDVINSLRNQFKRTGISIEVHCRESLKVYGNPGYFDQLLTNLLINSLIHAYDRGERAGTIDIRVAREEGWITMLYGDDGNGMEESARRRLFEPFFTTNREGGGSGLGMYICYNLVTTRMGGEICCDSAPGQGSAFYIRFPLTHPVIPVADRDPEREPEIERESS